MAAIRNDKPLSLYTTCQPSGGANGMDARGTHATNTADRALTRRSVIGRRKTAAKRAPKVHAKRANPADITGTRNPRKPTNPGNKPTRITSRSRNAIQVTPGPRSQRPLRNAIY